MSELESLVKNLSDKFDGLQKDLDMLKHRSEKRKKHGKRHSHHRHRRHSSLRSRTRSSSDHRGRSRSRREQSGSVRTRSRSRSVLPPRRGTRGHHDRDAETPGVERERMPRSWEDIPDTPRYDEVIDWENNSDVKPTGHGKSKAPPTSVAAVSEETGSIIHGACTFRLDYQDCLKVRNAYILPKGDASRTPTLDSYIRNETPATTKAVDKELSTIQMHVLDALAP